MPAQTIEHFTLPNGFDLLVEEMPDVQSAAFTLLIPAGSLYEAPGANGTSAALCDLALRGAGDRDNRELATALDRLGVQRHEQVGWNFLSFGGALLANKLPEALAIYADVARRPLLPPEEFEAVMSGLEQSLLAIDDEPGRKLSTELRRHTYPDPWGRPTEGDLAELRNVTLDRVRELHRAGFRPNGAILGIAGRVDAAAVREHVERLFGDWTRGNEPSIRTGETPPAATHLEHPSTQVQIGLAYHAPPYGHADYYAAWAAASVLGGGPSARLFTEVRERRGLCYSVQASLHSLKTEARTIISAGTTTERAQETLDVILSELDRLGEGIGADELRRCQARAKSSLIMQQESTAARAASIARDWFHLGRIVTLNEVRQAVEELTVERLIDSVRRYPPRPLTVLTLGPQPLQFTDRLIQAHPR
ncbi:MAG: insulinase family protein [Planctomyces sp.]|nr:insulinase family protein [Planctomyces sp.]